VILTATAIAGVVLGVGILILVVGDRLDDNRIRDPQLTFGDETVEPMPDETIGVLDGDSEADTGGAQ